MFIRKTFAVLLSLIAAASVSNARELNFEQTLLSIEDQDEVTACVEAQAAGEGFVACEVSLGLGVQALILVESASGRVIETGLVAVAGFVFDKKTLRVTVNQDIDCRLNPKEVVESLEWDGKKFKSISVLKTC
jgi:hypothetical protein